MPSVLCSAKDGIKDLLPGKIIAIYLAINFALIAQLVVTLSDGSTQINSIDDSWSYNFGPIRDAEIYHGEYYDSRFNIPGWSIQISMHPPGLKTKSWIMMYLL